MDDSSITSTDSDEIQTPVVRYVMATTKVVDLTEGELVDSGGNFCMCNDLSMMVNIRPITPFGINMAAIQDKTAPMCTHRGYFPIPMITHRRWTAFFLHTRYAKTVVAI
jgi:hypothetical protein